MSEPIANVVEVSVSELSRAVKRAIEDGFGWVRVRGEVSGFRGVHSSGHAYFSLKDADAKIDAVIWRGSYQKLKVKPQEGLEVVATGRLTTFPGSSKYQIVIESLEPAGIGALMALLEERRKALAAEGLFDAARKVALPRLPKVIGVVTSPTGAVIRDILHRIADRFPVRVIVWPVRVQGETSAREVAEAIAGFDRLPADGSGPMPRPDVLIVARGGGSLEDLWSFNEEIVVRAAAACSIPLVSAIGHETDWTLIDQAADLRAPTPTGAAEMVVPVRADLLDQVDGLAGRLGRAARRALETKRGELRSAARALPSARALVETAGQRLDIAAGRLARALDAATRLHATRFARLSGRLSSRLVTSRLGRERDRLEGLGDRSDRAASGRVEAARRRLDVDGERLARALDAATRVHATRFSPLAARLAPGLVTSRLGRERDRLADLDARAVRAVRLVVARRADRLAGLAQVLAALSYRSVLARGFALVRDDAGRPIAAAAAARPGAVLSIEFADGRLAARVEGEPSPSDPAEPASARRTARPRRKADPPPSQGSLF